MGKLNGNLKYIVIIISVVGFLFMLADKVWYTSKLDSVLSANVAEDIKVHMVSLNNEKEIIGVKKDVEQNTKRIAEFITEQKIQTDLLTKILSKP